VTLILCMLGSAIHYLKKVNLDDYSNLFCTVFINLIYSFIIKANLTTYLVHSRLQNNIFAPLRS
jgi:hypothetical protein